MLAEVRRWIMQEELLPKGRPVWVAVSGGVDSMVLLHVLRALGHPCRVAHVDHGLRGAESDGDRRFVEELARKDGLPFRMLRLGPSDFPQGISVQMAARELRYRWFRRLLAEGPPVLALGHHADDLAETLLLHLLRGVGSQGWAGIAPMTKLPEGTICRPLLGVDRAAIVAYARANGIGFREDASNNDPKYLRNRVRSELIPLMEQLRPGARCTLARGAGLLRELGAAARQQVEREAQDLVPGPGGGLAIPRALLARSASPRLLLMHLLGHLHPHPDQLDQLLGAVRKGATGARFLWGGIQLTVDRTAVIVGRTAHGFPTFPIDCAGAREGMAGPFHWRFCDPGQVDTGLGMDTAWLDVEKLGNPLLLRPWRTGDRMRPLGLGGSKLISDILVDDAVPLAAKPGTYVLQGGEQILWLAGHRIAEGVSPGPCTTRVLRLTFSP